MSVPVAPVEIVNGARPLAEAIYTYILEFRQLALFSIPSVQDLLTRPPLFEQQPGDGFHDLLSIVGVAPDRNYTYPVRMEELFSEHFITGRRDRQTLEKIFYIPDL
jgi:hypothetical protein